MWVRPNPVIGKGVVRPPPYLGSRDNDCQQNARTTHAPGQCNTQPSAIHARARTKRVYIGSHGYVTKLPANLLPSWRPLFCFSSLSPLAFCWLFPTIYHFHGDNRLHNLQVPLPKNLFAPAPCEVPSSPYPGSPSFLIIPSRSRACIPHHLLRYPSLEE